MSPLSTNPLLDDLLRPFATVEHLVALLALGLLLGAASGPTIRRGLLLLMLGLGAGLVLPPSPLARPALLALAVLGGALVALVPAWRPAPALGILLAAAGVALGMDAGLPRPDGPAAWARLGGLALGVLLAAADAAAAVDLAWGRPMPLIALRVAGSWLAAIALMVLAFEVRGGGGA